MASVNQLLAGIIEEEKGPETKPHPF
jgi:hypothetical protein